ncbi:hypothetical protein WAI453_006960 [Rhynchosporium graminicola]
MLSFIFYQMPPESLLSPQRFPELDQLTVLTGFVYPSCPYGQQLLPKALSPPSLATELTKIGIYAISIH